MGRSVWLHGPGFPREAYRCRLARGVRKATMAAFNANYRLLKKDPSNGAALDVMKELLPMVIQLNYFRWWTCTDDWVQAIVDAAQATYDEEHGTNSARGP